MALGIALRGIGQRAHRRLRRPAGRPRPHPGALRRCGAAHRALADRHAADAAGGARPCTKRSRASACWPAATITNCCFTAAPDSKARCSDIGRRLALPLTAHRRDRPPARRREPGLRGHRRPAAQRHARLRPFRLMTTATTLTCSFLLRPPRASPGAAASAAGSSPRAPGTVGTLLGLGRCIWLIKPQFSDGPFCWSSSPSPSAHRRAGLRPRPAARSGVAGPRRHRLGRDRRRSGWCCCSRRPALALAGCWRSCCSGSSTSSSRRRSELDRRAA
ncbi:MAG: hypothetical protein MZV65_44125 [Chromatiales bacterium]|nr:hypothetical protein [Chromatiales bacterium]